MTVMNPSWCESAIPRSLAELPGHHDGIERARIERHPDHHAGHATVLEGAQVLHGRNTSRGEHRESRRLGDVLHQWQVGPFESSLTMHGRHEEAAERVGVECLYRIENVER